MSNITDSFEYFQDITSIGNNSISLIDLPLPLKLFSFMFRPLFIDARGIFPLLMSLENIILLFQKKIKYIKRKVHAN